MNTVTLTEQRLGGAFQNIPLTSQFDIVEYTFQVSKIDFVAGVTHTTLDISSLTLDDEFRKKLSIYKHKAELFYIQVYVTDRKDSMRVEYYDLELANSDHKKIKDAMAQYKKSIVQSI